MASSDVRQNFSQTRKEKILARIAMVQKGCWIWQPKAGTNKYGVYYENGKYYSAHRASYEAFVGVVPEGLVLDHLCGNPSCVNPSHLEPVTQLENVRRAKTCITTINAQKTHCKHGHEFTVDNTHNKEYKGRNHRSCRTCVSDRQPEANERRRLRRRNLKLGVSYGI